MDLLQPAIIQCPYCSQTIEIVIDCSVPNQEYIEDCQVCCKPISLFVSVGADDVPTVEVRREDE